MDVGRPVGGCPFVKVDNLRITHVGSALNPRENAGGIDTRPASPGANTQAAFGLTPPGHAGIGGHNGIAMRATLVAVAVVLNRGLDWTLRGLLDRATEVAEIAIRKQHVAARICV